jgi:VIT1/CCC1 family predicted Fe2+/Mn2+ transporter
VKKMLIPFLIASFLGFVISAFMMLFWQIIIFASITSLLLLRIIFILLAMIQKQDKAIEEIKKHFGK